MIDKVAEPTTPSSKAPSAPSSKTEFGVKAVWMVLLDTSTRLFVPSVGGTVVGLWLDITNNTKPWFTIIGVIGGTLVAIGLVALQLKAVDKQRNTPSS